MPELFDYTILSFTTLFAIMDPVGLIPAFVVMTANDPVSHRIRMARLASLIACCILLAVFVFGKMIFQAFGITLPAFEIAGGVILLLVGLDMLQARRTPIRETEEEQSEGVRKEDIAVTPLAVPMLAGPGAITTVILLGRKAVLLQEKAVLAGNIVLVSFLAFVLLRFAALHSSVLSKLTLKIITRLMGLILTAIAMQFILDGIRHSGILALPAGA